MYRNKLKRPSSGIASDQNTKFIPTSSVGKRSKASCNDDTSVSTSTKRKSADTMITEQHRDVGSASVGRSSVASSNTPTSVATTTTSRDPDSSRYQGDIENSSALLPNTSLNRSNKGPREPIEVVDRVIELAKEVSGSAVRKRLRTIVVRFVSKIEVLSVLARQKRGARGFIGFVDGWLKGGGGDDDDNGVGDSRRALLEKVIPTLRRLDAEEKEEAALYAATMINHINELNVEESVTALQAYSRCFADGNIAENSWLDLLAVLLEHLSSFNKLQWRDEEMTGSEAKCKLLEGLLNQSHTRNIGLTLLRDVDMVSAERRRILETLLNAVDEADVTLVADLVDTALKLSDSSSYGDVVEKICQYFTQKADKTAKPAAANVDDDGFLRPNVVIMTAENVDDDATQDLKSAETQCVIAIFELATRRMDFRKMVVKTIKDFGYSRTLGDRFSLSVLLSLSTLQGNDEGGSAAAAVKVLITASLKDANNCTGATWLKPFFPLAPDMKMALRSILTARSPEWMQLIAAGAYELGFLLVDSSLARMMVVGGELRPQNGFHAGNSGGSPAVVCQLGIWLLQECFQAHDGLREKILRRLLQEVLDNSTSQKPSAALCYIDLLSRFVKVHQYSVFECRSAFGGLLSSVERLSEEVASPLLTCLLPVIKLTPALRNAFVDALKRAMFSGNSHSQKIAVRGCVLLLKSSKIFSGQGLVDAANLPSMAVTSDSQMSQAFPSFSSQAFSEFSGSSRSRRGHSAAGRTFDAICLEAVGCLHRALTLQADVRSLLYQGLRKAVFENRALIDPIADMLIGQLEGYLEENDQHTPPLKLTTVLRSNDNTVEYLEPLPQLLQSVFRCLRRQAIVNNELRATSTQRAEESNFGMNVMGDTQLFAGSADRSHTARAFVVSPASDNLHDVDFDKALYRKVKRILMTIIRRVADTELEDFALDKNTDFDRSTNEGLSNVVLAKSLLRVYEALIEITWFLECPKRVALGCNHMVALNAHRLKLLDVLREKAVVLATVAKKQDGSKRSNKTATAVTENEPAIFTKTIQKILEPLAKNEEVDLHENLTTLRESTRLIEWLFVSLADKLIFYKNVADFEGVETYETLRSLACLMLEIGANSEKNQLCQWFNDNMDGHWVTLALQNFAKIVDYCSRFYSTKLKDLLVNAMTTANTTTTRLNENSIVRSTFSTCSSLLLMHLPASNEVNDDNQNEENSAKSAKRGRNIRNTTALLQVLNIVHKAEQNPKLLAKCFDCLQDVCRTRSFVDVATAKDAWRLMFDLQSRISPDDGLFDLVRVVLRSAGNALGQNLFLDNTVAFGDQGLDNRYCSITAASASAIVVLAVGKLETALATSKIAVARLTLLPTTLNLNGEEQSDLYGVSDGEVAVATFLRRFTNIAKLLAEIELDRNASELRVKFILHLLNNLLLFVKHYTTKQKRYGGDTFATDDVKTKFLELVTSSAAIQHDTLGLSSGRHRPPSVADDKPPPSSKTTISNVRKDENLWPELVKTKEKYELELMMLAKKCDLMDEISKILSKCSTVNRDFRYHVEEVKAALNIDDEMDVSQEV